MFNTFGRRRARVREKSIPGRTAKFTLMFLTNVAGTEVKGSTPIRGPTVLYFKNNVLLMAAMAALVSCSDDGETGNGTNGGQADASNPDVPNSGEDAAPPPDGGLPDVSGLPDASTGPSARVLPESVEATCATDLGGITDPEGRGRELCAYAPGVYSGEQRWTADTIIVLNGSVVGDLVQITGDLDIEAGTLVLGRIATLVIRESMINVNGEANNPVVMTSLNLALGRDRQAGDWGGVAIVGRAWANCSPCTGEAGIGSYGSNSPANDTESSGTIRYLRVEFTGGNIDALNQYNGLALYGVGSGTTIENVHIHRTQDDGIEFFGGAVSVKNLIVTGAQDDSIDWTDGWRGSIQFAVAEQYDQAISEHGIEADNLDGNNDAVPVARPVLSNLTFVTRQSTGTQRGFLLRRGTGALIYNVLLVGHEQGIQITDDATEISATDYNDDGNPGEQRGIAYRNVVFDQAISPLVFPPNPLDDFDADDVEAILLGTRAGSRSSQVLTDITVDITANSSTGDKPSYAPASIAGFPSFELPAPNNGFTFEAVDYIGAVPADGGFTSEAWVSFPEN